MSRLRLVTWNINSVRLRMERVAAFIAAEAPDILCLQEIKCRTDEFPGKAFAAAGLPHLAIRGQGRGQHGVAIASRLPLELIDGPSLCREGHARIVSARIGGHDIHNLYVPSGGDAPDPDANPKFAHKLDFLAAMARDFAAGRSARVPQVLVGDLNVAPQEHDVWSHRQLLNVVSHTPVETEALEAARAAARFIDVARHVHPPEQKLYTWWSYRARDWAASNRGRRLDHVWTDRAALDGADLASFRIHLAWRGGVKPSDHAPVSLDLAPVR